MSNEYDPQLQALFDTARQSFDREAFTRRIVERIDQERHRTIVVWSVFGLFGIVVFALLAKPVFAAFAMATQLLPVSLIEIETGWLRQLLSPINSVAAVIALGVLGICRFFRRLLR